MRALNTLLAIVVSALVALAVFEGGLRLLGLGPEPTLNEFHATLGWSKKPDTTTRRKSRAGEYDVRIAVNALGLRDDPMSSPAKPDGTFRVLCLGDSFTLGYTVERDDLYVDQLERWWRAEGRAVDVVNAGTEGYSTDQCALWLAENGAAFEPDLVLYFAYENDLYWCGQTNYAGKEKPRYDVGGALDHAGPFPDPPPPGLDKRSAIARLVHGLFDAPPADLRFTPDGGTHPILKEFAVLLNAPPGFATDAVRRTGGALRAMHAASEAAGAPLVLVALPSHSGVDAQYAEGFGSGLLGLAPERWSADLPVDALLALAAGEGVAAVDARPALRAAQAAEPQYYRVDWHLNPAGNATIARLLHDELDARGLLAAAPAAQAVATLPPAPHPTDAGGLPGWLKAWLALFVALTALHWGTYRDLPRWRAPLEVGGMLASIFLIVWGLLTVIELLPPRFGVAVKVLFVVAVLLFVAYKLGRRLGTILELLRSFTLRGHWYLMPLVMVLLSIGSLLVVAASSPLVAPFIYTLF